MKVFKGVIYFAILLVIIYSCRYDSGEDLAKQDSDLTISLRWVKSHSLEKRGDITIGLAWALSFLGATLPEGSLSSSIVWKDASHFILDLHKVGFSENAEKALRIIVEVLKESDEDKSMDGVDLGRFIMLTLNSPRHYYAITEAEFSLEDFKSKVIWTNDRAAIINSSISFGNRVIEISRGENATELAFIATEGHGSLLNGSFLPEEIEAFRIMPNGQLRFLLYNADGRLKNAADTIITMAGKPSKCLWCHETTIMPTFSIQPPLDNFISTSEFLNLVSKKMELLEAYRKTLKSDIDFNKRQDHTFTELLYIGFMEPSAERLAIEWEMEVQAVKELLTGLPTHSHREFTYLGVLYNRIDVEARAPYRSVQVPSSTRDYSSYEPDFFK